MKPAKPGFLMDAVTLPLDRILPSRQLKPSVKTSTRYKMIEASIRDGRCDRAARRLPGDG